MDVEWSAPFLLLEKLQEKKPRIHCITNPVAQNLTANVLLALGANPSMTINTQEIASFVEKSDALLVNLGMMDEVRRAAIPLAIAATKGKPWVLDPAFINNSPSRLALAKSILAQNPTVLRCNASEAAMLGHAHCVYAITGEIDKVSQGHRHAEIALGHEFMSRVTGMGCALSAFIAAFLTVEEDAFTATHAALALYGLIGKEAGALAKGPGSFVPYFLDCLYEVAS